MDYLIPTFNYLKSSPQVIAALIASGVAIWGILSQRQLSRQKNSLDFEGAYKRNKEISEANQLVISMITKLQELTEKNAAEATAEIRKYLIDSIPVNDQDNLSNIRHSVIIILNEWERAANAVFSNLYDEDYLYRAHATSIIKLYTYLKLYIEERQRFVPRYYINFTRLALRWSARRCKEDESEEFSKKLNKVLSDVQNAGVQFQGHKVTESRHGALKIIKTAQHDIWLTVNKPGCIKRFLVFIKLHQH